MSIKNLLVGITPEKSLSSELSITLIRVFFGLSLALGHGMGKLPPGEQFVGGVRSLGFPMPELFAWAASLSEFLGGLFLAVGLLTRPASFFVAFTMATAFLGVHAADPYGKKELAVVYFVVALCFLLRGASRTSVDRLLQ